MKQIVILFFLAVSILSMGQPAITQSDMPSVGDTIRTRSTMMAPGINYQATGTNFTWDFSSLSGTVTAADTFIAVTATPLIYQLAFNLPFDPNRANLASPQEDISFIPNFPLTEITEFYKKSAASYAQCGFGATLSGIPVPIKFNNLDIWYKFPLTAGSAKDSSMVSFSQGLPGFGHLSIVRKRVNEVDGWGTVITPAGSYSCLRMKSVVQENDSIYIDTLNFGFNLPRNYTEYKWLASGKGIPVMQVSTVNLVPVFTWIDTASTSNALSVQIGPGISICQGDQATLTATATGGNPPYFYIWSTASISQTINVSPPNTTTYTVTVTDASFQIVTASCTITVLPSPVAAITPDPNQTFGCSGGTSVTTFTLTATPGFVQYAWSSGVPGPTANVVTTGPPSPAYTGTQLYSVTVTDQAGCTGDTSLSIDWMICTGIAADAGQDQFLISPNPGCGVLNLSCPAGYAPLKCIEVYHANGTLLHVYYPEIKPPTASVLIKTADWNAVPGMYFFRLISEKGSQGVKVILE